MNLLALDLKLQNAKPEDVKDLRREIQDLIDELSQRLKYLDREFGQEFTLITRKRYIKPTLVPDLHVISVPNKPICVLGKVYDSSTLINPDTLYLDGSKFHLNICGTKIIGELSSILVPGRDKLMKCTPCKKCTKPYPNECNYFHPGEKRNFTIDYLRPPPHHSTHNHDHSTKINTPSYTFHCRYFGCATHIDSEIKTLSKDDFQIMRQLLLNLYIYYSAVVYNRPDLLA
jgi:hypothetical protein